MGLTACVHRGTGQIGGTCVELQSGSARLLLDLGMPLDANPAVVDVTPLLPDVSGLRSPDPTLLALILSHGHADHWGLVPHVTTSAPVVMGAATRRIMCAAAPFVPYPAAFALGDMTAGELVDRVPVHMDRSPLRRS
jgi:ribonuclease J